MVKLLINLIALYQKSLSPDHSWVAGFYPHGFCRYAPTCSEYVKQALLQHGILKGALLSVKRISKCNPYAGFGYDPVPERNPKHEITTNFYQFRE